jgi:nicotinate phosphoribosyltransferase
MASGTLPRTATRPTTSLLTDKYELTMLQAALADGTANRHCIFEVFTRRLPPGRRYGVLAGTGRFLEALGQFRFGDEELAYLDEAKVVDARTRDFLANYKFTGNIRGYAEGEIFFPGSPVLQVEGSFAEACIIETLILSILNFDSAIASAASRMTSAAVDRPCLEMGARRTNEQAGVAAARAAVIAGFAGTSNLEAGRRYGIPTIGTAAHAFTLVHDDELEGFKAQIEAFGTDTTLLVDTYDVHRGVENAIAAGGTGLGAVRLDSGDLGQLAVEVRHQLDALGATSTKITVTSDLDEYAIAALAAVPVDSYGVGTSLVTGSGAPTCGMVYKLVAREDASGVLQPVAKKAPGKGSTGGFKSAARRVDSDGRAVEEVIVAGTEDQMRWWTPAESESDLRPLMVDFVMRGVVDSRWTGERGIELAVARHEESRAELPVSARRLSADEPELRTVTLNVDRQDDPD